MCICLCPTRLNTCWIQSIPSNEFSYPRFSKRELLFNFVLLNIYCFVWKMTTEVHSTPQFIFLLNFINSQPFLCAKLLALFSVIWSSFVCACVSGGDEWSDVIKLQACSGCREHQCISSFPRIDISFVDLKTGILWHYVLAFSIRVCLIFALWACIVYVLSRILSWWISDVLSDFFLLLFRSLSAS